MKVMIIGADQKAAIEQIYLKYLRDNKIETCFFASQNLFNEFYHKNVFRKILFKMGISRIYTHINGLLKTEIKNFAPDIIWVFKGMEIFPDTLIWAKQNGIKLINYNPDHPFIFSGEGSGNTNVTHSIAIYQHHLTYHEKVKKKIEMDFNIPTSILPFGFDISPVLYSECECEEEIIKTCFIGNPDPYRVQFVNSIANDGIPIDIFGHNWEKIKLSKNITVFDPVYGDHYFKALRKYRIQLNIMRIHNLDSHNMRSFEIPAVGGIMLAPNTKDHAAFFKEEKEIFLYKNTLECVAQIHKILDFSTEEAETIRKNARNKSLTSDYSYKSRTQKVVNLFNEIYED